MSLSQPRLQHPCHKFIEFKGNTGVFQYYDKTSKTNIELKYPIEFIVLDELSTITGFSDSQQAGIYSNEVKSLQDQALNVRVFKSRTSLIGKYADIKGDISAMGGKFCKSVYAALRVGDGLELVNFQLKGIAFSAWMEKTVDLSFQSVKITTCSDGKKGAVKYKIPNYEAGNVDKPLFEKAVEMDKKLQEFLVIYQRNNDFTSPESNQQHPDDTEAPPAKHYNEKAITPASANHRGEPAAFDAARPDLVDDSIPF